MIFGWEDFYDKEQAKQGNEEEAHKKEFLFRKINTTWDDRDSPAETFGETTFNEDVNSDDYIIGDEIDKRYFYKANANNYEVDISEDPLNFGRKHFGIPQYRKSKLNIEMTNTQKCILEEFPPVTDYKADKLLQRRGNADNHEYLVKWHGRSYRDSTWLPTLSVPRNMIKGQKKHDATISLLESQGHSNPEVMAAVKVFGYDEQITRVPEESLYTIGNTLSLVKWTNTPYTEATWEQTDTVRFERQQAGFLREYQKEGVKWLLEHLAAKKSCVLGDEFGLGRKVQVLVALDQIRLSLHNAIFLVTAPDNAVSQWKRVCDKWTSMRSVKLSKGRKDRGVIESLIFNGPFYDSKAKLEYDVLIIPHSLFQSEYEHIKEAEWSYAIVEDQTLHLKDNIISPNFEYVLAIAEGARGNEWATLLSNKFEKKIDVLERTKEDIYKGSSLCTKVEYVALIEQTSSQRRDIKAIIDSNIEGLVKGDASTYVDTATKILKRCNYTNTKSFSEDTGKMSFMYKFVYELIAYERDSKILILASSDDVLEFLEKYLTWIEAPSLNISSESNITDDSVKSAKILLADKMRASVSWLPSSEVDLIDTVIIYESDLNPFSDNLKIAEFCPVRKGKAPVKVYRFITKGSCEQYALATMSGQKELSFEELTKMLKYGVCNAYRENTNVTDPQDSVVIEHVINPFLMTSYKGLCFANSKEESDFEEYINDRFFWANITLLDGGINEFQLPKKKKSRLLYPSILFSDEQKSKINDGYVPDTENDPEGYKNGNSMQPGSMKVDKSNEVKGEDLTSFSSSSSSSSAAAASPQGHIQEHTDKNGVPYGNDDPEAKSCDSPLHSQRLRVKQLYTVRRELGLYGWGNWTMFRESNSFMDINEIKRDAVYNLIMALNNVEWDVANAFSLNIFKTRLPEEETITTDIFIHDPIFQEFPVSKEDAEVLLVKNVADKFLRNLEISTLIHRAAQKKITITHNGPTLSRDWTEEDDYSLLKGFDKWGHLSYEKVLNDKSLGFVSKLLPLKGRSKSWPLIIKRKINQRIRGFFNFAINSNVTKPKALNTGELSEKDQLDNGAKAPTSQNHGEQKAGAQTVTGGPISEMKIEGGREYFIFGDERNKKMNDGYEQVDGSCAFDNLEFDRLFSGFDEGNEIYKYFLGQKNCLDPLTAFRILQYGAAYGFPHIREEGNWSYDYKRIAGIISRHNREIERREQVTPGGVRNFLRDYVDSTDESAEFPYKSIFISRINFFKNIEYVVNSKMALGNFLNAIDFTSDYPFPNKDSLWKNKEWDKAAIRGVMMYGLYNIWNFLRRDPSTPFYNARESDIPSIGELIARFNNFFVKARIEITPIDIGINIIKRDYYGNVIFPVVTDNDVVLESVGEPVIGWDPLFTRGYLSVKLLASSEEAEYHKYICTVLEGEDMNPEFHINGDKCKHVGKTPLSAWRSILYELHYGPNEISDKLAMDYFGFTDPTIISIIIDNSRMLPK